MLVRSAPLPATPELHPSYVKERRSMVTSTSRTSWALLATSNKVPSSCQGCCSSCLICRAGLSSPALERMVQDQPRNGKMAEKLSEAHPQEQRTEYLGIAPAIQSLQFRLTPFQSNGHPFYDCFALLDINPLGKHIGRLSPSHHGTGAAFLARIFPADGDLWEESRNSLMGTTLPY